MKRFLISSDKYDGNAELFFDAAGRLVRFDVMQTNMTPAMIQKFKERVPATSMQLESAFEGTNALIVEADYEISFKDWWDKYDKKINKVRCLPLWEKLAKADQVKAYYGVEAYDKHLKKDSWRPKADPEKYLRDRYWENEWK